MANIATQSGMVGVKGRMKSRGHKGHGKGRVKSATMRASQKRGRK